MPHFYSEVIHTHIEKRISARVDYNKVVFPSFPTTDFIGVNSSLLLFSPNFCGYGFVLDVFLDLVNTIKGALAWLGIIKKKYINRF